MNKPKQNHSEESCKSYILAMVWRGDGFIEKRVWSRSDGVRGIMVLWQDALRVPRGEADELEVRHVWRDDQRASSSAQLSYQMP